ncbi:MAG: DUF2064 domain-containing protein [bacterium]
MILDAIQKMAQADDTCSLIVSTDGPLDAPIQEVLEQLCTLGRDVRILVQSGRTFEQRFLGTLDAVFERGFERVVALGSDTPAFSAADVRCALLSDQLTVGPSRDGGFYLVGLSADEVGLLRGLPWRTTGVFKSLFQRACHMTVLSTRADVDSPQDAKTQWTLLCRLVVEQLGELPDHNVQIPFKDCPPPPQAPHRLPRLMRGPPVISLV